MTKGTFFGLGLSLLLIMSGVQNALADLEKRKICRIGGPISGYSDFNGDGIVDNKDLVLIKGTIKQEIYYAFYDLNVDGRIDKKDIYIVNTQMGNSVPKFAQNIAKLFHQIKQFQILSSKVELKAMGFTKRTESYKGRGEFWTNSHALEILQGKKSASFNQIAGVMVPEKGKAPWGAFWIQVAKPVFKNGATDFPKPDGAWMNSRVVSFGSRSTFFAPHGLGQWFAHPGLCSTTELVNGKKKIVLNQHTTFLECQALPSLDKVEVGGTKINPWVNIWILHIWMFDINSFGLFRSAHECMDPNSTYLDTINRGRERSPSFLRLEIPRVIL